MANANIGVCDCPVCGNEAGVRLTKKSKAYIVCAGDEGCGFQGFARGEIADKLLRGKIRNVAAPAAVLPNVTEPAAEIAPVEVKPAAPVEVKKDKAGLTIFDKEFYQ